MKDLINKIKNNKTVFDSLFVNSDKADVDSAQKIKFSNIFSDGWNNGRSLKLIPKKDLRIDKRMLK